MLGIISARVYIIVAIIVGAFLAAVVFFDTGGVAASFFSTIAADARPFLGGTMTDFVFLPFVYVLSNYYWAIGAAIFWPVIIIWFIFFLIGMGATIFGPSLRQLNSV